jgi:septum formation protein
VLASASPRRSQLLAEAGVVFEVVPADVDESAREDESAEALCERLGRDKARAVASRRTGGVVVAGDTIVVRDGAVLGKPADRDDAAQMLRSLSGRRHEVFSSVALCRAPDGPMVSGLARSTVSFDVLDDATLGAYLDGSEWEGKAGAYAIQGDAAGFARLEAGSHDTVVGLPVALVGELAQRLGAADSAPEVEGPRS